MDSSAGLPPGLLLWISPLRLAKIVVQLNLVAEDRFLKDTGLPLHSTDE